MTERSALPSRLACERWGSGTDRRRSIRLGRTDMLILIGSVRRECTDHLIVFNAEHLQRILVASLAPEFRPRSTILFPSLARQLAHTRGRRDQVDPVRTCPIRSWNG